MFKKLKRKIAMVFLCPIGEHLIRTGKFGSHEFYELYRDVRVTMKHSFIDMDYEDMRSLAGFMSELFKKYPHIKEWATNIVELTWKFYNT
jgi:hypothetical protein